MGSFVAQMIELSEAQVQKISQVLKEEQDPMSLRFIKPSQQFYDRLMSIWIRLVKTLDQKTTVTELKHVLRQRISQCEEMRGYWRAEFERPAKTFINVVLEEH